MSNQEIRSSVEAIDTVVRNYAEDIEIFRQTVDEKMNSLDSALFQLSRYWEGPLQQQFDDKMRMRISSIRSSLERADQLKGKLDDIAAEMASLLEILRAAGSDQ